jgi:ABC-type nitrate/sulfonate/bicarbonate transport system substrate-binding protein
MSDIDYYVVPEPAASTKVNAISALNFAGDLQELYGGDSGYPQAVIVAKSSFVSSYSYINEFLSAVERSAAWIADESTSAQTIVNAVQTHLTAGMSATFNANNLTKSVIANCGVKLTSATDSKEEIKGFMQKLNSVSATSFGTPDDNFFFDGTSGNGTYGGEVNVYAPDGAPALGLAKLLAGEENLSVQTNYEIVDASTIQTYVTGANPKADICVLPVNLATKLLGSGETYKLVGTLTHGNLYMVSASGTTITSDNISSLKGKRVGVVNLAAVPGLTFKLILKNNGIEYSEEG